MREIKHPPGHCWAKTCVVGEEAVDHEREMGVVAASGNDQIRVRVAQRVDFDLLSDPIGIQASDPRITLGDIFELTAAQAGQLAVCLQEAALFSEIIRRRSWRRPRLVSDE